MNEEIYSFFSEVKVNLSSILPRLWFLTQFFCFPNDRGICPTSSKWLKLFSYISIWWSISSWLYLFFYETQYTECHHWSVWDGVISDSHQIITHFTNYQLSIFVSYTFPKISMWMLHSLRRYFEDICVLDCAVVDHNVCSLYASAVVGDFRCSFMNAFASVFTSMSKKWSYWRKVNSSSMETPRHLSSDFQHRVWC